MHSHCTSSEGPRSEPWLGAPSWPTCSPGLRSKCPAPALLSVSPLASQLRSNPKETFTERLSFARQSNLRWFTDASLRAGGLPSGFKAHLTGPLCRGPAPNVWLRPFPRGPGTSRALLLRCNRPFILQLGGGGTRAGRPARLWLETVSASSRTSAP